MLSLQLMGSDRTMEEIRKELRSKLVCPLLLLIVKQLPLHARVSYRPKPPYNLCPVIM